MALAERIKLYKKIEAKRKNPLVVYVTSQRQGAIGTMASDAIDELIDQVRTIEKTPETQLDLLIESMGGDPLTSWRVVSLLRSSFKKVCTGPHSSDTNLV